MCRCRSASAPWWNLSTRATSRTANTSTWDYEQGDVAHDSGYLHAEFRRQNPFPGWGGDVRVNTPPANIANAERLAWDNNYVILDAAGRGHYIGCNLSVTNFQGTWWGEGDDMIWVDGYKWPPDLHGTGSEDYLNQAWGMQDNAFLRNGSSIYEYNTRGYQTSYVHHLDNPVRFQREIKVTIEHGHGNHLCNEMASVAYWYADRPGGVRDCPPVRQRLAVKRDNVSGDWLLGDRTPFAGNPTERRDACGARAARPPAMTEEREMPQASAAQDDISRATASELLAQFSRQVALAGGSNRSAIAPHRSA